ncbi:MAG: hypothetical protein ACHQ7H_13415 [Candidatus Rokuibacteriota bacterium]|jgi:hypothetical protein
MRNLGFILLLVGVAGFFYCSSRASQYEPLRAGLSVSESLETERGQWDAGRYAAAAFAFTGIVLTMLPKGR